MRPWFKFFARDYLESDRIDGLTLEQEAVYIRALCVIWLEGEISQNQTTFCQKIGKSTNSENIFKIFSLLEKTSTGAYTHGRILIEKRKAAKVSKARSKAGKKSGKSRRVTRVIHKKIMSDHDTQTNICSNICSDVETPVDSGSAPEPLVYLGKFIKMSDSDMRKLIDDYGLEQFKRELLVADRWIADNCTVDKNARKYAKPGHNSYLFFRGWLRRNGRHGTKSRTRSNFDVAMAVINKENQDVNGE